MSASPFHCSLSRRLLPRRHRLNHFTRGLLLGGIGWLGMQTSALATDVTWTGGGSDSSWSTEQNWNGSFVTTGADSLLFGSAGAGTIDNDIIDAFFGRIHFLEGAGAYTLEGAAISLGINGINNVSSQEQTIDLGINITSASSSFRAWGGNLVVNGVVSGTGRITTTTGASGVVYLKEANTHTGGVAVNSGLRVGNANALGSGVFMVSGGSVTFDAGIENFYTGGLEGSGALVLQDGAGEGIALHLSANGSVERGGVISGKGGIVLDAGSGKQVLAGANTYTGGTWIKSGTLEVGGGGGNITGSLTIDGASFPSSAPTETRE